MNEDANKLTVGQAFAARWLVKHYEQYRRNPKIRQRQPGLPQPEDLSQAIAGAVDVYVEKKVEELRSKLRAVAVEAADGNASSRNTVAFGIDELLQDRELVWVAQQCLNTSMSAIYKFPV